MRGRAAAGGLEGAFTGGGIECEEGRKWSTTAASDLLRKEEKERNRVGPNGMGTAGGQRLIPRTRNYN